MPLAFTEGWNSAPDDISKHIVTEQTATALLESAAKALSKTEHMEVSLWNMAITGASDGVVQVYKGGHQAESAQTFHDTLHLTMSLNAPRKYIDPQRTTLNSSYHLYVNVLEPTPGQTQIMLQPTKLTYMQKGDLKPHDIAGADAVKSDYQPGRK